MLSKFSVKKPLTVFVAVIAVLVLGAVAFTGMTPDLLPNMDIPYVVVITAYPGATPEKVESTVTKPLERVMATLDSIDTITSTSSENVSSVVLGFTDDVDMESVTVDILQQISQVEGGWDDMVGTPTIMKLNPSMLPVMVAAVDMEGMETVELSTFVDENLLNKLEGITGVASISASGMVEETLQVELRQDKIDKVNTRIQNAVDKMFAENEAELADTRRDLESQKRDLEDALAKLKDGQGQLADKTAEGEAQIFGSQQELINGKLKLIEQIGLLQDQLETLDETAKGLQELANSIAMMESAKAQLEAALPQLEQALPALREGVEQMEQLAQTLPWLSLAEQGSGALIEGIQNSQYLTDAQKQQLIDTILQNGVQQMLDQLAEIDAQLAAQGLTREGVPARLEELQAQLAGLEEQYIQAVAGLAEINDGLAAIDAALAEQQLTRADVPGALAELAAGKEQLEQAVAALQQMLAGLDSGAVQLPQALQELSRVKTNTIFELSTGAAGVISGQAALEMALVQVESGEEQLESARDSAMDSADIRSTITMDMVANILQAQNFAMPAGYVTQDGIDTLVSVGDAFASEDELRNLLLFDPGIEDLEPVYLTEVADIRMTSNAEEIYARINGQDGVLLTFTKQSNHATATVSDGIQAKFDELSAEYPGLHFVSLMDQGDYIYLVVNAILQNLLLGAIFAVIILFLFLRDIRPTFITLCSIPVSVIFAIALMYFSGVTINIISLSGLAVAVGMLVDNSVVVIENIYRLRGLGYSRVKAAVSGAAQMSGAIIASTLTTVSVFLPIVFVEGLTRDLFTDMALTLGYSLLASLIVALTLVPAMSAGLMKKGAKPETKFFQKFLNLYRRIAGWTLRHRAVTLVAAALMLVLSLGLSLIRGFSFMPSMSMPQMTVNVETPEGTTLAETKATADLISERIQQIEGVETVGALLAGGGMFSTGSGGDNQTSVTMYLLLDDEAGKNNKAVADEVTRLTQDLAAEVSTSDSSATGGMTALMGGSGITVELYGEDLQDLQEAARGVAAVLDGLPGTGEVNDGVGETDPELHFVVNKEKAMREGLTVAQVYTEVSAALAKERAGTTMTFDGSNYDVAIIKGDEESLTPDYIRDYTFTVTDREGEKKEIALRDIATVEETETAVSIARQDQRRYISVSAALADGYNVTLVSTEARQALQEYQLPAGVTMEYSGENETIMEAFVELLKMLGLGVLLVYLIMVAQFQSLKSPFIVMFTIPLAFTGGLLALVITGMELSVIALIGFVMLVGIIVNNGIVLVDYINQLRIDGMERREAILEAGATRMRPILMTSITTILGLIMMAIGSGMGSELMQPIAIVCIGGLAYATLLTLFVVPVIYDLLNKKELRTVDEADLIVTDD